MPFEKGYWRVACKASEKTSGPRTAWDWPIVDGCDRLPRGRGRVAREAAGAVPVPSSTRVRAPRWCTPGVHRRAVPPVVGCHHRAGGCRYRRSVKAIRRFTVRTVLPEPLRPLGELA